MAVKTLAQSGVFSEVVIGDANIERARQMAKELVAAMTALVDNEVAVRVTEQRHQADAHSPTRRPT